MREKFQFCNTPPEYMPPKFFTNLHLIRDKFHITPLNLIFLVFFVAPVHGLILFYYVDNMKQKIASKRYIVPKDFRKRYFY